MKPAKCGENLIAITQLLILVCGVWVCLLVIYNVYIPFNAVFLDFWWRGGEFQMNSYVVGWKL